MTRHRFDPVSFVLGLVFVLAAVIVLAGGRLIAQGRVIVPLGLMALGFALLVRLASEPPDPSATPEPASGEGEIPPADTSGWD